LVVRLQKLIVKRLVSIGLLDWSVIRTWSCSLLVKNTERQPTRFACARKSSVIARRSLWTQ